MSDTHPNHPPGRRAEHLDYLLTAYLFENISAAGKAEVERHLAACPACRAQLEELRETLGLAAAALDDHGREYVFEERRKKRVLEAAKNARHDLFSRMANAGIGKWAWKAGAVAAVLVVVLLIWPTFGKVQYSARRSSPRGAEVPSESLNYRTQWSDMQADGNIDESRTSAVTVKRTTRTDVTTEQNEPTAGGLKVYPPGYADDYSTKDKLATTQGQPPSRNKPMTGTFDGTLFNAQTPEGLKYEGGHANVSPSQFAADTAWSLNYNPNAIQAPPDLAKGEKLGKDPAAAGRYAMDLAPQANTPAPNPPGVDHGVILGGDGIAAYDATKKYAPPPITLTVDPQGGTTPLSVDVRVPDVIANKVLSKSLDGQIILGTNIAGFVARSDKTLPKPADASGAGRPGETNLASALDQAKTQEGKPIVTFSDGRDKQSKPAKEVVREDNFSKDAKLATKENELRFTIAERVEEMREKKRSIAEAEMNGGVALKNFRPNVSAEEAGRDVSGALFQDFIPTPSKKDVSIAAKDSAAKGTEGEQTARAAELNKQLAQQNDLFGKNTWHAQDGFESEFFKDTNLSDSTTIVFGKGKRYRGTTPFEGTGLSSTTENKNSLVYSSENDREHDYFMALHDGDKKIGVQYIAEKEAKNKSSGVDPLKSSNLQSTGAIAVTPFLGVPTDSNGNPIPQPASGGNLHLNYSTTDAGNQAAGKPPATDLPKPVTLNGVATYSGATAVSGGTLNFAGTRPITGAGATTQPTAPVVASNSTAADAEKRVPPASLDVDYIFDDNSRRDIFSFSKNVVVVAPDVEPLKPNFNSGGIDVGSVSEKAGDPLKQPSKYGLFATGGGPGVAPPVPDDVAANKEKNPGVNLDSVAWQIEGQGRRGYRDGDALFDEKSSLSGGRNAARGIVSNTEGGDKVSPEVAAGVPLGFQKFVGPDGVQLDLPQANVKALDAELAKLKADAQHSARSGTQLELERHRAEAERKYNMALDQSRIAFETGRYDVARQQAEKVLELDPANTDAHAIVKQATDKGFEARKNNIAEEYRHNFLLQRESADRTNIPHSDYLIYPYDWRQIAQRTAEEKKPDSGSSLARTSKNANPNEATQFFESFSGTLDTATAAGNGRELAKTPTLHGYSGSKLSLNNSGVTDWKALDDQLLSESFSLPPKTLPGNAATANPAGTYSFSGGTNLFGTAKSPEPSGELQKENAILYGNVRPGIVSRNLIEPQQNFDPLAIESAPQNLGSASTNGGYNAGYAQDHPATEKYFKGLADKSPADSEYKVQPFTWGDVGAVGAWQRKASEPNFSNFTPEQMAYFNRYESMKTLPQNSAQNRPILLLHPRLDPNFPTNSSAKTPSAPVAQYVPPVYETKTRKVCVTPESAVKHPAPAVFETRTRKVVVSPERTEWQKNDCNGKDVKIVDGVCWSLVNVPAVFKDEPYQVCVNPGSCTTETIPGVFKDEEYRAIAQPARWHFNSPITEELYLRSYRFLHTENPKLNFAQFLRRPDSIRPEPLSDLGLDEDTYVERFGTRPFVDCARDHLSTFSLDVDTASYTLARAALREGKLPAPESVKVEEFLNYFKQDYQVKGDEAFGVFAESARSPFADANPLVRDAYAPVQDLHTRELLRIGIKSREPRANERKPAMLTFVVDTSGSMRHPASKDYGHSRLHLVKDALKGLVDSLNPEDAVSIVGFGDQAEMILPRTQARQKDRIVEAIDGLTAGGATNIESGLMLGFRLADESFAVNGVNRMILCGDGAANLGIQGPDEILKLVKVFAQRGIDLSTVGVGRGQINDPMLRKLADEGNGSCHYADSLAEAKKIFAEKLPPHLNVLARDAKVQVDFNPDTIKSYRLLGYEKRKIADKDFRNDKVDAGEIAHSTLVTAFYELVRQPGAHGPLGKVYLRWKDAGSPRLDVVERNYPLDEGICAGAAQNASSDFRFLASVARFAELLRESKWVRHGSYAEVLTELDNLPADYKAKPAWSEVRDLVTRALQLSVAKWQGQLAQ